MTSWPQNAYVGQKEGMAILKEVLITQKIKEDA